LTNFKIH